MMVGICGRMNIARNIMKRGKRKWKETVTIHPQQCSFFLLPIGTKERVLSCCILSSLSPFSLLCKMIHSLCFKFNSIPFLSFLPIHCHPFIHPSFSISNNTFYLSQTNKGKALSLFPSLSLFHTPCNSCSEKKVTKGRTLN